MIAARLSLGTCVEELFKAYGAGLAADDPRIKMQASEHLLDRAWGKAVQPMSIVPLDSLAAGDALASE